MKMVEETKELQGAGNHDKDNGQVSLLILLLTHSLSEHNFFSSFQEKVDGNQHSLIKPAFVLESRDVSMNKTDDVTAFKILCSSQGDRKSTSN